MTKRPDNLNKGPVDSNISRGCLGVVFTQREYKVVYNLNREYATLHGIEKHVSGRFFLSGLYAVYFCGYPSGGFAPQSVTIGEMRCYRVAEIAHVASIVPRVACRLLRMLAELGYIERIDEAGKRPRYRNTVKFYRLFSRDWKLVLDDRIKRAEVGIQRLG